MPRFGGSGYFMPRCLCPCQQKAQEERKAMEEQRERMERIKRRKAQGLQDRYLYDYTFANDNGQNPVMEKACAYVEHCIDDIGVERSTEYAMALLRRQKSTSGMHRPFLCSG